MERLLIRLFKPVMERTKSVRLSQLAMLPVPPDRVLFLGDSITEQGMWHEWFPDLAVLNRGVGSDTVGGVSRRATATLNRPAAVSLLIGTNDLGGICRSSIVGENRSVIGSFSCWASSRWAALKWAAAEVRLVIGSPRDVRGDPPRGCTGPATR